MKKHFRPRVRTKNFTAVGLRGKGLPLFPFPVIVRIGSISEVINEKNYVVINSVEATKNSSHKLKAKKLFADRNLNQSVWYTIQNNELYLENHIADKDDLPYPLLAKQVLGKKGEGMIKINNRQELDNFLKTNTRGYFIEKFYNYGKEYRIHTSLLTPCFYTCRKVRRQDSKEKWFFNSTNCNWLVENNPDFDKPNNWNEVVRQCQQALFAVGLDIGAVDVRIQHNDKSNPDFIICEINSGPAFGNITLEKYREEITKIAMFKNENKQL